MQREGLAEDVRGVEPDTLSARPLGAGELGEAQLGVCFALGRLLCLRGFVGGAVVLLGGLAGAQYQQQRRQQVCQSFHLAIPRNS